ncbi:MAG: hypothetical protein J6S14_12605 [Clostridia bacterium]|nr:hypothetical protein [Clostridia bacterium]
MKYDDGIIPAHVYCHEDEDHYLRYSFNVASDGIYELAVHLRIKDEQLRGATYTINKGASDEHSFATTYGWSSQGEALAIRNDDQGAYMSGMEVYLHAGVNTVHITPAVGVTKTQHFRELYLAKSKIFCEHNKLLDNGVCKGCGGKLILTMDEAEAMGVGLVKGTRLPDYYYTEVTFNNGAPRNGDGFCRVITSNNHKMSIYNIILADGQTMPLAGETVILRGKIGCVNSNVNGSIGQEARIFDATIV